MYKVILKITSFLQVAYVLKEDGKLYKLIIRNPCKPCMFDIYYGRVTKIISNIGFLIALNNKFNAILPFSSDKGLNIGERVLVQVIKEETTPSKYSIVSSNINYLGGMTIYNPNSQNILSKNIKNEEKREIKLYLDNHSIDKNLIIRSSYSKNFINYIELEYSLLKNRYYKVNNSKVDEGILFRLDFLEYVILHSITKNIKNDFEIIYDEYSLIPSIELLKEQYTYLVIHSQLYVNNIEMLEAYKLNGVKKEILDNNFFVSKNISCNITSTSDFNYIDVNFKGGFPNYKSKEQAIQEVNKSVVEQIAEQIYKKNLCGQILVDLLKNKNNFLNKSIIELFKDQFVYDTENSKVLGFSNLGLLEISRKKIRDSNVYIVNNVLFKIFGVIINIKSHLATYLHNTIVISSNEDNISSLKIIAKLELDHILKNNISLIFKTDYNKDYVIEYY